MSRLHRSVALRHAFVTVPRAPRPRCIMANCANSSSVILRGHRCSPILINVYPNAHRLSKFHAFRKSHSTRVGQLHGYAPNAAISSDFESNDDDDVDDAMVASNFSLVAITSVISVQQFIFILVLFSSHAVNHVYFCSLLVLSIFIHFSSYSVIVLDTVLTN